MIHFNQNKKSKFTLAILSSKGGSGKTMLASSLVDLLARDNYKVNALDCDVNAPNLAVWLGEMEDWDEILPIEIFPLPNKYKNCQEVKIICDGKTMEITLERRGEVKIKKDFSPEFGDYRLNLISGSIDKGKTGSGKCVEKVIEAAKDFDADFEVIDSAPGTGYPVVTPLKVSSFAVLVTEPTILGFMDIKKLADIAKINDKDFGIVVNRWSINPDMGEEIKSWAGDRFLGGIDFSSQMEQNLRNKLPATLKGDKISRQIEEIYSKISNK